MRTAVVTTPLEPARLLDEVAAHRHGASVLFVGTVREVNDGRAVTGIDYRAYEAMAVRELDAIVREAIVREPEADIVAEHRLGTLELGDASVAIAVAHPRRAPAFETARRVLEELKARLPIWKLEHYVDGTREWVGQQPGAPLAAGESRR